jgi:hypothetical protein
LQDREFTQNARNRGSECNALIASVEHREKIVFMARAIKNNGPTVQRVPKGQKHFYTRWEGSPLWRVIDKAVCDLVQNQDLVEDEYHEYIVGYICKTIDRRKKSLVAQLQGQ